MATDVQSLRMLIANDNDHRPDRTWSAWFEFDRQEQFDAAIAELRRAPGDIGARPDGGGRRLLVEFQAPSLQTVAEIALRHHGRYQMPSPRVPRRT